MKATVTSKGQITIPLRIRQQLDLEKGTVLEFEADAGCLLARKVFDFDKMRSVIGIGKTELAERSSDEWLEDLRGPVELPLRKNPQ